MRVIASDSIASVKLRVQTSRGATARKQKLVFDGRELARDDGRIRDYGVGDGNVVHLVRIPDLRLITVQTVQGGKFRFRVEPGQAVGYVKRQIAKDRRLNTATTRPPGPDEQRLVLEDEDLDDRHLIHDVCRADGAVIHLLVQRAAAEGDDGFEVSIVARDAGQHQLPLPRRDVGIEPVGGSGRGAHGRQQPARPPMSSTGEVLKKGTRVGEGALREVAAYILDHPPAGFAGVPPTALVRCTHKAFRRPPEASPSPLAPPPSPVPKLGSMQAFLSMQTVTHQGQLRSFATAGPIRQDSITVTN